MRVFVAAAVVACACLSAGAQDKKDDKKVQELAKVLDQIETEELSFAGLEGLVPSAYADLDRLLADTAGALRQSASGKVVP
mgnify:CR=1 FL=1